MNEREALKQALEALERGETELRWKAIAAIQKALALKDFVASKYTQIGWITRESRNRLREGGNCIGAVPIHAKKSSLSIIPVYIIKE